MTHRPTLIRITSTLCAAACLFAFTACSNGAPSAQTQQDNGDHSKQDDAGKTDTPEHLVDTMMQYVNDKDLTSILTLVSDKAKPDGMIVDEHADAVGKTVDKWTMGSVTMDDNRYVIPVSWTIGNQDGTSKLYVEPAPDEGYLFARMPLASIQIADGQSIDGQKQADGGGTYVTLPGEHRISLDTTWAKEDSTVILGPGMGTDYSTAAAIGRHITVTDQYASMLSDMITRDVASSTVSCDRYDRSVRANCPLALPDGTGPRFQSIDVTNVDVKDGRNLLTPIISGTAIEFTGEETKLDGVTPAVAPDGAYCRMDGCWRMDFAYRPKPFSNVMAHLFIDKGQPRLEQDSIDMASL